MKQQIIDKSISLPIGQEDVACKKKSCCKKFKKNGVNCKKCPKL